MATELSFTTLTSVAELDAVADRWDALADLAPRPSPFLLTAWIRAWSTVAADGAELVLEVACRDGRVVAAAPFQVARRRGVRVLELVGGVHAQLGGVLLDPAEDPALADDLVARGLARADAVDLAGLPAGSAAGRTLRLVPRIAAPVVDLSDGWDALYRSRLSSKRRSQHRKRLRTLEEAGAVEIEVAASEAALGEALRLHGLRWHGRRDGSTYGVPFGDELHRALLTRLGDRARIALLRLDGRAIAFRYGIRVGDSLVGNGIGFDPAYGRFSPGWLLLLAALERAAAEGVRRVELLGGDESYKLQLADPEPLHHGLAARTLRGRAAVRGTLAALALRERLKRSAAVRRLYRAPRRAATADV